jgi:hypothetical protein
MGRRVSGVVLAVLAVSLLASPVAADSSRAERRIRRAVVATQDEESARLEMSMTYDIGGQTQTLAMNGVLDLASGDGVLTMTVPISGGDAALETRIVDGIVYLDFGDLVDPLRGTGVLSELDGVRWIRATPEGSTAGTVGPVNQHPASQLEALRGIDDVERVGRDEVDGVATTHFKGTVDLVAAAEAARAAGQVEAAEQVEQFFAGDDEIPVEVWLDDENRTRRMKMRFAIEAAPGERFDAAVDMRINDFGVPIDVQAPPADEVIDLAEFEELLLGRDAV